MATSKLLGGIKAYGLGFDSTAYMAGNIFELYPVFFTPVVPGGGLAGVIPLAPGQIQNLFKPIDSNYMVPWRREYKQFKLFHVRIKIQWQDEGEDSISEKYFLVQAVENPFTVEIFETKPDLPKISATPVTFAKITGKIKTPTAKIHTIKIKKIES